MGNDYKISLKATLDENSLAELQKQASKDPLKVPVDIVLDDSGKTKKAVEKQASSLSRIIKDAFKDTDSIQNIWSKFGGGNIAADAITKVKQALSELKEVDSYLTKIAKENDRLSKSQLERMGTDSFRVAGDYGTKASDYLSSVSEMSRAGYRNAESMAKLSASVQSAGDMTAALADQYVISADRAYALKGNITSLTQVLDGANNITDHNAVSMTELADGMAVVGSQAASSQMKVEETTAAISTLVSVTHEGGAKMGKALKGVLMNLRQLTGDAGDGEKAIDETSLLNYKKACEDLGVSLSTVKNGIESLKDPMQIIRELSEEYQKLKSTDTRRTNLLDALGGNDRAAAMNALLENYNLYEKMLKDYASGQGSLAEDAEKTANSWEGSMNRLSNSWTEFINSLANKELIIGATDALSGLLRGITEITDATGLLLPLLAGTGITAFIKNLDYPAGNGYGVLKNLPRFLRWSNIDKEMIKWFKVQVYAFGSFKINQRGVIAWD